MNLHDLLRMPDLRLSHRNNYNNHAHQMAANGKKHTDKGTCRPASKLLLWNFQRQAGE